MNIAAAGDYNGGSSADYFRITDSLESDITITGGTGSSGNIFYATSGIVTTEADQSTIYITDSNYNIGDVLLIDAGIENLTKDFFGEGRFYNFSNDVQSTIEGIYARNVFDASELLKALGMNFSMIKVANRADVELTSGNYVGSSTNLIWMNNSAASLEMNQTDNILLFADTNTQGDLISLVGDYNDTIHVGTNDSINAGDGDNVIYGWDSSNVLILDELPENISMVGSDLVIETDSSNTTISAVDSTVKAVVDDDYYLIGNSSSNVLTAESTSTTLWGNGGNDTLIGGSGADVFRFTSSDDNVTIQNGDSNDTVSVDFNFSDVSSYEFTDTGLILSIGESSLNVIGSDLTTFNFSDGTHIADFSNKTF